MLINKNDLVTAGLSPTTAARFITMLDRLAPSTTIASERKPNQKGMLPTRNFDLQYVLSLARKMEVRKHPKVDNTAWVLLRSTLEKINMNVAILYCINNPTIAVHSVAVDHQIDGTTLHDAYRIKRIQL